MQGLAVELCSCEAQFAFGAVEQTLKSCAAKMYVLNVCTKIVQKPKSEPHKTKNIPKKMIKLGFKEKSFKFSTKNFFGAESAKFCMDAQHLETLLSGC